MTDTEFERAAQGIIETCAAWKAATESCRAYAQVLERTILELRAELEQTRANQNRTVAHLMNVSRAVREARKERDNYRAAYTRQTQLALAAGLVRWVMTGDRP